MHEKRPYSGLCRGKKVEIWLGSIGGEEDLAHSKRGGGSKIGRNGAVSVKSGCPARYRTPQGWLSRAAPKRDQSEGAEGKGKVFARTESGGEKEAFGEGGDRGKSYVWSWRIPKEEGNKSIVRHGSRARREIGRETHQKKGASRKKRKWLQRVTSTLKTREGEGRP